MNSDLKRFTNWYHDFTVLGIPTKQRKGSFALNQKNKQDIIFRYIRQAIALCEKSTKGIELFCADGFYSNYAAQNGAEKMRGIDINYMELICAHAITAALGNKDKVTFMRCDILELTGKYDFGICAGGLYHLSEPQRLLALLRERIKTALVIQTVVSLANTHEDYFETPAPNWKHGCRFSHSYLLRMIEKAGWKIIEYLVGELEGNSRLEDRGSAYLLCT